MCCGRRWPKATAAGLLVLGTYRDTELGRRHPLAGVMADVRRLPGVEQLAMAGLSVAEVAELMSQAAGQELDDDARRLAEGVHAETQGNPFFVGSCSATWSKPGC